MATEADDARPRTTTWRAGLTPASAALLVAAVVTAFVLADAFVAAHRTIGWIAACSVVALLIDPVVGFVARVVPRWIAVLAVLLVVLTIIASITAGLANDLVTSIDELKEGAPRAAQSLEERYDWMADIDVADRVTDFVADLDKRVRKDAVSEALGTAPSYLVTSILMLFLLAYGRRYFEGFVDQFSGERRERVRTVGQEAASRGRRYLLVVLGQAIVNGTAVGVTCWMLGLPAPFSLGVFVGALTLLPLIGVLVGGIPALLLAFGLDGWWSAACVLAVILVLQTLEVAVVRPVVDARTVRVGPSIPIVVGLLGFELYGIGGSVYGIALAVIALAALDSVGRLRGDDEISVSSTADAAPSL